MLAGTGGMVDPRETTPTALVRELREETGVHLHGAEPEVLWTAYVNDPRNTDWAWVATTAALFHLDSEVAATAGSEALDAC